MPQELRSQSQALITVSRISNTIDLLKRRAINDKVSETNTLSQICHFLNRGNVEYHLAMLKACLVKRVYIHFRKTL